MLIPHGGSLQVRSGKDRAAHHRQRHCPPYYEEDENLKWLESKSDVDTPDRCVPRPASSYKKSEPEMGCRARVSTICNYGNIGRRLSNLPWTIAPLTRINSHRGLHFHRYQDLSDGHRPTSCRAYNILRISVKRRKLVSVSTVGFAQCMSLMKGIGSRYDTSFRYDILNIRTPKTTRTSGRAHPDMVLVTIGCESPGVNLFA